MNGIKGVLEERFLNLGLHIKNVEDFQLLCQTPAAALGSCRLKIKERTQLEQIITVLRRHDIGYFIYIGGNDSMDTVAQLSAYCEEEGISDICIMGAPKTIDNDLMGTDHCPGFGSAAKYIASTFAELERDCHVYDVKAVTIVEVMGRNAGWLTAASALARLGGGKGPDLIYLCENSFVTDRFLSVMTVPGVTGQRVGCSQAKALRELTADMCLNRYRQKQQIILDTPILQDRRKFWKVWFRKSWDVRCVPLS